MINCFFLVDQVVKAWKKMPGQKSSAVWKRVEKQAWNSLRILFSNYRIKPRSDRKSSAYSDRPPFSKTAAAVAVKVTRRRRRAAAAMEVTRRRAVKATQKMNKLFISD